MVWVALGMEEPMKNAWVTGSRYNAYVDHALCLSAVFYRNSQCQNQSFR
jgi:hypothetical protein